MSYGANHDSGTGNNRGYLESFADQFVAGTIINTLESFNAKSFGGVGGFGEQGQLSTFVELGGTFAVGNASEPLTFSISDNEVLLENFLYEGQTWVEAAWASIPWISWQQIVLGDPLATATLITDPQTATWNGTDATAGSPGNGVTWSEAENWSRGGLTDTLSQPGDEVTFAAGSAVGVVALGSTPVIVERANFQASYRLVGDLLAVRSGVVSVAGSEFAELATPVAANGPLRKQGTGTLALQATAPATFVEEGTLTGAASLASLEIADSGHLAPGQGVGVMQVAADFRASSGARLTMEIDDDFAQQPVFDQLQIGATAALGGSLEILPRSGYADPVLRGQQQTFSLLSSASREGTFDTVIYDGGLLEQTFVEGDGSFRSHVDAGLFRIARYLPTGVTWTHYLALEGDTNGDGLVGASSDGATLLENLGATGFSTWLDGDFDDDGSVTASTDGGFLLAGLSADLATPHAIPEPTALALGALAILWFGLAPRRPTSSATGRLSDRQL